jgi:hypothetical protein
VTDAPDHIECRFCTWKTPKWKRSKGKTQGPTQAFARLRSHLFDDHPMEAERIYAGEGEHSVCESEELTQG